MVLFERNFYLPGCFAAEVSVPGVVSDAILEIRMLAPTGEVFFLYFIKNTFFFFIFFSFFFSFFMKNSFAFVL